VSFVHSSRLNSFALLRTNRNFALLWIADFVSSLGDRVHQVAMAALVYRLTGSLTQTGIAFIATALPDLVLGPAAGVLVDRWDRRRVLILCDLARIPLVLSIPLVAQVHIGLVFVFLFGVNAVSVAFRPARRAIVPSVVKPKDYNTANSLSSVSENSSDILGYPLGGGMLALLGIWLGTQTSIFIAFGFDAITYLLSAILIWMVRPEFTERAQLPVSSIWVEFREGVAFVNQNILVRANTLVTLLGPIALGASTPLLVGYAWEVLQGGEWEYSLIGAGISAGSVLGGLWLSTKGRVHTGFMVLSGLALMGLSVALLAVTDSVFVAVLLIAVGGFGSSMVLIPGVTLVQDLTPNHLLGRVFSLRSTLFFGAIVFSTAIGGWAGDVVGIQASLFLCGILLMVSVGLAVLFPSVRAPGVPPDLAPQSGNGE
jgi:MFS transporter, DHA3 family, macrolide efflux protein